MKISYNWLKKYIGLTEAADEVSKLLTNSGLEVEKLEEFESVKGGLKGFLIGEVLTCEKHPDADKLKKVTVDVGNGITLPIVCGASNVAQGQKVIVATVGTTIYPKAGEPFVIKKAKIRGEISEGMICAEDEIGIGDSHEGILTLDTILPPGTEASKYFELNNDFIFEIGLTPNRADAASHFGVARDLRAVLRKDLFPLPTIELQEKTISKPIEVVIENTDSCPRYAGISLSNIEIKDSPLWLQEALKSIGLSPINNVVDITNFILHDLGQPLHAFDLDKISGNKIIVKNLPASSEFVTLDNVNRKLSATDLMICDAEKPLAIAGVFGGKNSGITPSTKNIFIESAYFAPESIRKTSLGQGLKTEASFRYERGTDPNMPVFALRKAVQLLIEIGNASIASDIIDIYPQPILNLSLKVSIKRINKLIGKEIGKDNIISILNHLDIETQDLDTDFLQLSIPPYRVDVKREADIVEEILRIYGLNNIHIASRVSSAYIAEFPAKDKDKIQGIISSLLIPHGFYEIITNSLTKSSYASLQNQKQGSIKILNPLSETLDVLRQSLLFSVLEVVSYNINRQQKDLKLFEYGKIYNKYSSGYVEQNKLGLIFTGHTYGESYESKQNEVNFQYVKLFVDTILKRLGYLKSQFDLITSDLLNESMSVKVSGKVIATFGSVKDQCLKIFDIKQKVYFVDFDVDLLLSLYNQALTYKEIAKFPEVRRDLSLVLDQAITFQQINDLALKVEKKFLKKLNVFDIYEGDKIESGKKAYAISIFLQDSEQTMNDKIIDQTMKKLMESFEKDLGAVIRNKN